MDGASGGGGGRVGGVEVECEKGDKRGAGPAEGEDCGSMPTGGGVKVKTMKGGEGRAEVA